MNKTISLSIAFIAFAASAVFAVLPDSFVEYVASTNDATYVNTGILPIPSTTRMVVKLTPTVVDTTQRGIFGSRPSTTEGGADSAYALLASKKFRVDWVGAQTTAFEPNTNTVYTFDMIVNRAFINSSFYTYAGQKYNLATAGKSLYLFNMNDNGAVYTGLPQKLYAGRIYRDGTTLAANYIPCVKDGVAGLYDSVSSNILYSAAAYPLKASAAPHPGIRIAAGKIEAKLNVTVGAGGSVDITGANWVEVGSTVTLTSTSDSGKQALWASTHEGSTYTNSYAGNATSFVMPGFPVSVDASFVTAGFAPFVSDFSTLIAAAAPGDEILLAAGTYTLTKEFLINKAVTITGAGKDQTIIRSAPNAYIRGINMTAPALIRDFTVTGFTNELAGSGLYMTAGTADTVRVSFNQDRRYNLLNGAGINMTGGVVTNSLIDGNSMNSSYAGTYGIGIYMTAGLVVDSVIKDNWRDRNEFNGGGVAVAGAGTLLRCRIQNNGSKGKGNGTSNTRGMGVHMAGNGLVDRCVIVSNDIQGVWMSTGALRNSLVYGHRTTSPSYTAGVQMSGGSLYNCTITDNVSDGDLAGRSGLQISGGVAVNNIIYGNGPEGSVAGDCLVTGGTFNTNVIGKVQSVGKGNIVSDPLFVNSATNNFRLRIGSPAVDSGATISGITSDIDGTTRSQGDGPDIGAYERTPLSGALACGITVLLADYPFGADPVISAAVEGSNLSGLTYTWYLDGAVTPVVEVSSSPTFIWTNAPAGIHDVRLVVKNSADETAEITLVDALQVYPLAVFVDWNGSNEHPYSSPATAAHSLNAAYAALWRAGDSTTTVTVASGTYPLTDTVSILTPIVFTGAGAGITILTGADVSGRALYLDNADGIVSGVTLTGFTNAFPGGAVFMKAGEFSDSRITFNKTVGLSSVRGGAVRMEGGKLLRTKVDNHLVVATYDFSEGSGVYMTAGEIEDCEIFGISNLRKQQRGIGVLMTGGSMTRSSIYGNRAVIDVSTYGVGLYLSGGTIENSSIYSNGMNGVYNSGGTLRNGLIYGHGANVSSFAGVYQSNGSLMNCTISDNVAAQDTTGVSGLQMTGGTAINNIVFGNGPEENIVGSCLITGGTFNTNLVDVAVATGAGNIVAGASPFVNQTTANYRILPSSEAFNAGNNGIWTAFIDPRDLDGNRRIRFGLCDMGAYESAGNIPTLIQVR